MTASADLLHHPWFVCYEIVKLSQEREMRDSLYQRKMDAEDLKNSLAERTHMTDGLDIRVCQKVVLLQCLPSLVQNCAFQGHSIDSAPCCLHLSSFPFFFILIGNRFLPYIICPQP